MNVQVDGAVTQVLPERENLVEGVLEAIPHEKGRLVHTVVSGLADVPAHGNLPVRIRKKRPLCREGLGRNPLVVVFLEICAYSDGRIFERTDGDARGEEYTVVLGVFRLRVALSEKTGQPVQYAAAVVYTSPEIERALISVIAPVLKHHFVNRIGLRALAHHVYEPPVRNLPVKPRGRPLKHLYAFEPVRLYPGGAESPAVRKE